MSKKIIKENEVRVVQGIIELISVILRFDTTNIEDRIFIT